MGSALTTCAVWTAILRAEESPLPTTPAGSHPCEPLRQTYLLLRQTQEHGIIRTDGSTLTERSENDRPATRAETDASRQRALAAIAMRRTRWRPQDVLT